MADSQPAQFIRFACKMCGTMFSRVPYAYIARHRVAQCSACGARFVLDSEELKAALDDAMSQGGTDVAAGPKPVTEQPVECEDAETQEVIESLELEPGETIGLAMPGESETVETFEIKGLEDFDAQKTFEIEEPTELQKDESLEILEPIELEAEKSLEIEEPTELEADESLEIEEPTELEAEESLEIEEPTELEADESLEIEEPIELEAEESLEIEEPTELEADESPEIEEPIELEADESLEIEEPIELEAEESLEIEEPTELEAEESLEIDEPLEPEAEESLVVEEPIELEAEESLEVEYPLEKQTVEQPVAYREFATQTRQTPDEISRPEIEHIKAPKTEDSRPEPAVSRHAGFTPEKESKIEFARRLSRLIPEGWTGPQHDSTAAHTGQPAADDTPPDEGRRRFLVFTVGTTELAVPVENTAEIGMVPELTRVPHVAPWMLGIINLRGDMVSVADIKNFLGMGPFECGNQDRIILLRSLQTDICTAIIVNRISGMHYVDDDDIITADDGSRHSEPYISGAYEKSGQTVAILDMESLLLSDEMQRFRAM